MSAWGEAGARNSLSPYPQSTPPDQGPFRVYQSSTFRKSQLWNQPGCPSTDRKMYYICIYTYISQIYMYSILPIRRKKLCHLQENEWKSGYYIMWKKIQSQKRQRLLVFVHICNLNA